MINVSNDYKQKMKFEVNNYEHHYTMKNITRDLELTELLRNDTLTVNRFLRTANSSISPSTINLKLEARADAPAKMLIKEFYRKYKDFPNKKWADMIYEENIDEYLVRIGDLIVVEDIFNNEKITIFTGKVTSVVKVDTAFGREVTVRVDDNTIKGHEYTFSDDVSYENYYLYNSKDKEHSLLFILAKNHLEFPIDRLNIQDLKTTNGEHIKIPLATFSKGSKIMQEISQIIKSVYGNIYTMPNGDLKINSFFDKSYIQKLDITLGNKDGNYPILEFIETTDIEPKENKVEIKYSNLVTEEKTEVFSLAGQYATKDDAKIQVKKKTKGEDFWRIDFHDVVELDKTPIVEAYKIDEKLNPIDINYNNYILEWINDRTARVKFNNNNDFDIYIKKFAFKGRAITRYNENSIFYTEDTNLQDKQTNLKSVNLKFVSSKGQAIDLAKHTYYNECRPYKTVKLRTNNMPFLELEDVINLDYKKFNGKYQIIAINQTNIYTELILKQYEEYQAYNKFIVSERSSLNGGIKSLTQIKKEEKEAEDRIAKIEKNLKNQITEFTAYKMQLEEEFGTNMTLCKLMSYDYKMIADGLLNAKKNLAKCLNAAFCTVIDDKLNTLEEILLTGRETVRDLLYLEGGNNPIKYDKDMPATFKMHINLLRTALLGDDRVLKVIFSNKMTSDILGEDLLYYICSDYYELIVSLFTHWASFNYYCNNEELLTELFEDFDTTAPSVFNYDYGFGQRILEILSRTVSFDLELTGEMKTMFDIDKKKFFMANSNFCYYFFLKTLQNKKVAENFFSNRAALKKLKDLIQNDHRSYKNIAWKFTKALQYSDVALEEMYKKSKILRGGETVTGIIFILEVSPDTPYTEQDKAIGRRPEELFWEQVHNRDVIYDNSFIFDWTGRQEKFNLIKKISNGGYIETLTLSSGADKWIRYYNFANQ